MHKPYTPKMAIHQHLNDTKKFHTLVGQLTANEKDILHTIRLPELKNNCEIDEQSTLVLTASVNIISYWATTICLT